MAAFAPDQRNAALECLQRLGGATDALATALHEDVAEDARNAVTLIVDALDTLFAVVPFDGDHGLAAIAIACDAFMEART